MNNWIETTLGDVLTLQRGFDLPKKNREKGDIPVIASNGQVGNHSQAKVKAPGVVIGRSGSIGGGQYIEQDFWPLNTTLWVKDFKGNNERFCYYLIKSLDFMRFNAGSGVPTLNRNHIHPLKVNLPPLSEQKAIAHILGSLDDKIELNRRMNETLEAMAGALFKSWFVDFDPVIDNALEAGNAIPEELADKAAIRKGLGKKRKPLPKEIKKLFPAEFQDSELGPIPKGWEAGVISDCCSVIQNGGTPKRDITEYWISNDIPWLTSGEVRQSLVTHTNNYISEVGFKNSSAKLVPKDTTLVALYGATAGQVAFLGFNLTTNQAVCSLVAKDSFRYYNYLHLSNAVGRFASLARGSAQQNISKGIVSSMPTIIPQKKILEYFDIKLNPLFEKQIENQNQTRTLSSLRDTLLPKLLSGEIRVPDAEKLAEEVL